MFILFLLSLSLMILYLFIFFRTNSAILISYSAINTILFAAQGLFIVVFGFSHPQYNPSDLIYINKTFFYILIFEILLFSIFSFYKNSLKFTKITINENFKFLDNRGLVLFVFLIGFIIISSEFFLLSSDIFFQNKGFAECSNLDFIKKVKNIKIENKYLQIIKLFADFKYFLIIFLGMLLNQQRENRTIRILYYLSILMCIILGTIKGQKSVVILSIIFYIATNFHYYKQNFKKKLEFFKKLKFFLKSSLIILLFTYFIRLIAHLRNYYHLSVKNECVTYSSGQINSLLSGELNFDKNFFLVDLFLTRFNYLIPFSKIYEYVENTGSINGVQYLNNIIGLVPRFFWEAKPVVTNNMNYFAYQVELISLPSFSVGLRPVGESFLNLGWFGLIVTIFIAGLFYFLNLFRENNGIITKSIIIYLIVFVLKSDGYFSIIPGIFHSLVGWFLFFLLYLLLLIFSRKVTNST